MGVNICGLQLELKREYKIPTVISGFKFQMSSDDYHNCMFERLHRLQRKYINKGNEL